MPRIAFLGNDPWSVPPLEALAAEGGMEVAQVLTNPPRPAGRGSRLTPTAVAEAARRLGLPLAEIAGVREGPGFETLVELAPDVVVVVAYGQILSSDVLTIPRLGCVNLHFSLLPRWRGASPVQRTLLAGDSVTGVSAILMDEGMDTGPVLGVQREDVLPDDDAGSLGDRLARTGGHLLVAVLKELASGAARPIRQDESKATYAPKLEPGDRRLDWIEHAYLLERRVRALSPTPGAVTRFRGRVLKVLRARVEQDLVGEPGALAVLPDGFPRAATPKGSLVLLQVAAEGRSPMSGADWARGARILPLERLG